jgi:hypothetical protein
VDNPFLNNSFQGLSTFEPLKFVPISLVGAEFSVHKIFPRNPKVRFQYLNSAFFPVSTISCNNRPFQSVLTQMKNMLSATKLIHSRLKRIGYFRCILSVSCICLFACKILHIFPILTEVFLLSALLKKLIDFSSKNHLFLLLSAVYFTLGFYLVISDEKTLGIITVFTSVFYANVQLYATHEVG